MSATRCYSGERGFSLIELAAAFVPFALLGLVLFAAFGFTWRFVKHSEAGIERAQQARLTLQTIANELREASALPDAILIWSREAGDTHDAVGFLSARTDGAGRPFNTDTDGTPYWQGAVFYLHDPARGELRRLTAKPAALASLPLGEQGRILAREVRQFRLARQQNVITITLTMGKLTDDAVLEIAVQPRN